jgi:hypothetical protein
LWALSKDVCVCGSAENQIRLGKAQDATHGLQVVHAR